MNTLLRYMEATFVDGKSIEKKEESTSQQQIPVFRTVKS